MVPPRSEAPDSDYSAIGARAEVVAANGRALLKPCPPEWLEAYPVSPRVNSPRTNDARLLEPPASRA